MGGDGHEVYIYPGLQRKKSWLKQDLLFTHLSKPSFRFSCS